LGYNDTLAQCQYAPSLFARLLYHSIVNLHSCLWKFGRRSSANLIMLSVYHMPFRGIARMSGGLVSLPMLDGILMIVNGHFFKGLVHFLRKALQKKPRGKDEKKRSLKNIFQGM